MYKKIFREVDFDNVVDLIDVEVVNKKSLFLQLFKYPIQEMNFLRDFLIFALICNKKFGELSFTTVPMVFHELFVVVVKYREIVCLNKAPYSNDGFILFRYLFALCRSLC